MAVKWTDEQKKAIDTRDCSLLVSAAAGSGKTAVLVARIIEIITDKKHPVDIDRLLVVTFTNAAAAEMRERIRDTLEVRAQEEPDNVHLQRQLVLVHNARITTIHSFCLNVLRSHFQTVGIDPSFRVADQGEVMLLEQEAARETVDAAYETAEPEYFEFLEAFATGKSDQSVEETILQLYHFALGQPWPAKWLQECRAAYGETGKREESGNGNTEESQKESPAEKDGGDAAKKEIDEKPGWCGQESPLWLSYVVEDTKRLLADMEAQVLEALRIAQEPDGPYPYIKALESDLEMIAMLRAAKDYDSYAHAFRNMGTFARLGTKKDERISEQKKLQVQGMRSDVKDALSSLRQRYYYDRVEVLQEEFAKSGVVIRVLTSLAESFMEHLAEKKAEKNLLDFGDLEHLALQALVKEQDGVFVPTAAAKEYAEAFEEIMIDEYQDSNLVQELILSSVSGRGKGEYNLFMVGDVKQSIYRFRLARPELFMEKYRTYRNTGHAGAGIAQNTSGHTDAETVCDETMRPGTVSAQAGNTHTLRIDLHRNFRSRAEVLESVNYIFRQIMTENLGGVTYDEDAALYPGAVFEEGNHEAFLPTEMLLLEAEGAQKQQEEAEAVGRRIREIVGKELVWDKELGEYRPAKYSDIVILLRTVSGWADAFGEVLSDRGIPCFTGSQKGYFSAAEIRTVLAYLQILDNPVQDIPLAAVLRSAIGKLTDEELAKIRIFSDDRYFYDCCRKYREAGEDDQLRNKLEEFFTVFERLRGKCGHTPVHLLLWELLEATGYGEYAEALPAGRQRKANLDMLVEKAIAYEATSYRGLYHFIRYIENLKKYEVDYGEANIGSEAENTVRIMSIHKSKGLEFPIVFVCGLGKQFNESDIRSKVILHPDFGIACDFVDADRRTRQATLLKKAIQQKTASENFGEELRVLYVAMTRAKEKLILTGAVADVQSKLEKWHAAAMHRGKTLSYSWLSSASIYLDWIMPALLRHPAAGKLLDEAGLERAGCVDELCGTGAEHLGGSAGFTLRVIDREEREEEELLEENDETIRLSQLLNLDTGRCMDGAARGYLEKVFASSYPYGADGSIAGKLSVSELKKLSYMGEEDDMEELYQQEAVIPLIPNFRQEKEELTGAARGTAYHTFMENLDFSKKDGLELQLEELISCGKMSKEEGAVLDLEDIRAFLETETGRRMERAALAGKLYRERPFVLGVSANEIRKDWNPSEMVLVQGIIDAYFVEDGKIIVLDYKTDRVGHPKVLVEKYRAQLDYYAMALKRLTGCDVTGRIIYSFHLGREIIL